MNNNTLIRFTLGTTPLHQLTGKVKVLTFLALLVLTIMTFDFRLLTIITIFTLVVMISIKANWSITWKLMLFAMWLNAINLLLFYLYNPQIGCEYVGTCTEIFKFNNHLVVPAETLWYFVVRTLKVVAMFLLSLALIFIIVPSQLAAGLNGVGVPYKVSMIFSIALRYFPDIIRDYKNVSAAIQARGLEMDLRKTSIISKIKGAASIMGPLVLTAFDNVETISNALDLRGYGKNKKRTWYIEGKFTKKDKIAIMIIIFVVLFTIALAVKNFMHPTPMWYPF